MICLHGLAREPGGGHLDGRIGEAGGMQDTAGVPEPVDVAGRQRAGNLPRQLGVEAGVDGPETGGGSICGVFVGVVVHKRFSFRFIYVQPPKTDENFEVFLRNRRCGGTKRACTGFTEAQEGIAQRNPDIKPFCPLLCLAPDGVLEFQNRQIKFHTCLGISCLKVFAKDVGHDVATLLHQTLLRKLVVSGRECGNRSR